MLDPVLSNEESRDKSLVLGDDDDRELHVRMRG